MNALLLLACLAVPARAAEPVPFAEYGGLEMPSIDALIEPAEGEVDTSKFPWFPERLEYKVRWGFASVGTSVLETTTTYRFDGHPVIGLVQTATSAPWYDRWFPVRDRNESYLDVATGSSRGFVKIIREGDYHRDQWTAYDHSVGLFLSRRWKPGDEAKPKTGPVAFPVQDILSTMYAVRQEKLAVGHEFNIDVNTNEAWPLRVKVLRKEAIFTPTGRYDCFVVQPFLRDEGLFVAKGKSVKVWLTEKPPHVPVHVQAEVLVGWIKVDLLKRPDSLAK